MSVYVGIDVHRKRSQVAVVAEDGTVQVNKNVVNGSKPFLRLIGDLPCTPTAALPAAAPSTPYHNHGQPTPYRPAEAKAWCQNRQYPESN
jgi:hypothetical protein